ncbi:hypothetical protein [Bifidobacterium sp. SO1]|uniref:hypothetical protein n=1 Tax=Bifidobacterium sp. SO1 TaxID=2809029 RepID=UPI001BDCE39E|nr:hypothetical protein [Bifidobacterium sp. SO1]MBT1162789.1 hypothetical protein [Bifidobacterium sp. SO1]
MGAHGFWPGYVCGLVTPFLLLTVWLLLDYFTPLFSRHCSLECGYCDRTLLPEREGHDYYGLHVLLRWWVHELTPAHRRNRKQAKKRTVE